MSLSGATPIDTPSGESPPKSPRPARESDGPAVREQATTKMQEYKTDYKRALRWCGIAALAGLIAQHVMIAMSLGEEWMPRANLAVGAVLLGFAYFAARRNPRRMGDLLVSNPLIVSVLSLVTFGTILGTLIPQRIRPSQFENLYGSATTVMRGLFLEDLFHSLWFSGLVLLACTALVTIAIRRWPWTFPKIGYVAAHLGPVVILAGAVVGQMAGIKGRVDLEVGSAATEMRTSDWRTGRVDRIPLPFAVRLDDFRLESHDPVYRVFVFEHTGDDDDSRSFKPVLSIDPGEEKGKSVQIDGRFALRVDEYGTASGGGSGAEEHVLQLGDAAVPIEPNRTYENLAGRYVKVGEYYPHFTYDLENKRAGNVSDRPVNPAIHVEVRKGGPDGEVEYTGWLFANMPGFSMSGHSGDETDKTKMPIYKHAGGGGPAAAGPTVKVAVLDGANQVDTRELLTQNGRHFLPFADGRYVAVFRIRDTDAKNYYSKLAILKDQQVVSQREIFVNDPMYFGGYAFYQANFDPQNLRYSGIDVVKDPGLWFVYGGLVLMLLGVLHIFYLRTLGKVKTQKTQEAGA